MTFSIKKFRLFQSKNTKLTRKAHFYQQLQSKFAKFNESQTIRADLFETKLKEKL